MKDTVKKRKAGIETYSRILDVSADLFARKGYDGVSLYEIARNVHIKESSLYNHFRSKADILETLFNNFAQQVPSMRPTDAELDDMLLLMGPEEVLKSILFYSSRRISKALGNTAMILNIEKFHNQKAAALYFEHVVEEPARYYERLFLKMMERGMIKPIDAKTYATQYNYAYIALTKEYYLAQNGFLETSDVIAKLVQSIHFFCDLMKGANAEG